MTSVYGFGGVKLEIVSSGTNCVIPAKRGYCSQPSYEPIVWEQRTDNGRDLQRIDGWKARLSLFCENIMAGDEMIIEDLVMLINEAAMSGEAIRVYPKYNPAASDNFFIDCLIKKGITFSDISQKREIGQRLPDIEMMSRDKLVYIPFFTPGAPIRVLGTSDGKALSTSSGKAIIITRY